jgi:propanediol dehydratase, large subunit (EC 4.2.1.28)
MSDDDKHIADGGGEVEETSPKRSKRFEALDKREVTKDGFVNEWPEVGFVAMESPNDPDPERHGRRRRDHPYGREGP